MASFTILAIVFAFTIVLVLVLGNGLFLLLYLNGTYLRDTAP